ncbi:MAG: peptidase M16 [Bacteroidia bacterium]|nr:MAG: peptidase M16 [Bacteroidia bacterium]
MLDRTKAPEIQSIDKIDILPITQQLCKNGFQVYTLHSPESEIIQFSLFFKAGFIHQNKKLIANAFTSLLINGTLQHSAREIAEMLEQYGVFYNIEPTPIYCKLQFTFLKKNTPSVLPILEEIIKYANFPQDEIDIYIKNHTEQYQTAIKNVSVLAQWNYSKIIYGNDHPLNKLHTPDDYKNITRNDLLEFFNTHIHPKNGFIFVSGNIDATLLNLIEKHFGNEDFHQSHYQHNENVPLPSSFEMHSYTQFPDALQSAIKIGTSVALHSKHPDYFDFAIANTLLGGFFGSRLMSVIREEKGYTYGIYSSLNTYDSYSVFTVSAEVKAEHTQASIDEVVKQIELLQNTPPDREELQIVKNYLSGELLDLTDGILKQDNLWKSLITRKLDKEYYNSFLKRIKEIQPEEVSAVLKKYIDVFKLKKCIVGKIN